mgnify:CR=1 FL=1
MRVLFDTNVLLDAIANRADFKIAQELVLNAAHGDITGLITANSVTDIFYIARKEIGIDGAKDAIMNLMTVFDVLSVTGENCWDALLLPMNDYEDAVQAVCAQQSKADFIVSRDKGFANEKGCPVKVLSPIELLGILREDTEESET